MAKAAKAVPQGYHTITTQLTLDNAAQTIDWYKRALGAEEISKSLGPDGKVMHAELKIGDSRFMVNDVMQGSKGPKDYGGSPASLWLYVENSDQLFNQRGCGRRQGPDADGRSVLGRPRRRRRRSERLYVVDRDAQGRFHARRDETAGRRLLQADGVVAAVNIQGQEAGTGGSGLSRTPCTILSPVPSPALVPSPYCPSSSPQPQSEGPREIADPAPLIRSAIRLVVSSPEPIAVDLAIVVLGPVTVLVAVVR